MLGTPTTFDVDLNAVRDYNRLTVLLRHAKGFVPVIETGDWVQVRDEEGNLLSALVDSTDEGRLRLKVDWSTWTPPGESWTPPLTLNVHAGADTTPQLSNMS